MRQSLRILLATVVIGLAGFTAFADSTAAQTFEKIKALKGTWLVAHENHTMEITFDVMSNGSAVMESHMGMVSVYHLDNDSIMMTHYCSAKNQPRMRATKFGGPTLEYDFVDVTNTKENPVYINHLSTKWIDADTIEETWTSNQSAAPEKFVLKRQAASKMYKYNMISYFEIPVADMARAVKFYSDILSTKLTVQSGQGYDYADFPKPKNGGNAGALVRSAQSKPAAGATTVYLYVASDLNNVLARVEKAGGKIVIKKTIIPGGDGDGFFALFMDTEGNTVGLHSER